jgi:hypothetical protein
MSARIEIDGRWANPPCELVRRIRRDASRACGWAEGNLETTDGIAVRASWQRRVSKEFHRRLRAAGIYVEGA